MVSLVCQELFFGIFFHPSHSHRFPHFLNILYHETAGIAISKMEIFMKKKKKNNSENFDFYSSHQITQILPSFYFHGNPRETQGIFWE